ncbi:MAG: hypothetical protein ACRDUY_09590 [Nitriliruptorales bacterium]
MVEDYEYQGSGLRHAIGFFGVVAFTVVVAALVYLFLFRGT